MYMVVSKWQALPSQEDEFESRGRSVRQMLRAQPGVVMLETFRSEDGAIAVVGYENEETYRRIVDDPNGPFAKAIQDQELESVSHWLWSERGETVTD
jgi:hypothetical protein